MAPPCDIFNLYSLCLETICLPHSCFCFCFCFLPLSFSPISFFDFFSLSPISFFHPLMIQCFVFFFGSLSPTPIMWDCGWFLTTIITTKRTHIDSFLLFYPNILYMFDVYFRNLFLLFPFYIHNK